jgi:hypothetical protein
MRQLSAQQRAIMVHLYRQGQAAAPAPDEQVEVPWGTDGDMVFRASISRALRRLESRGLLRRLQYARGKLRASGPDGVSPQAAHHRTTHIYLLPAGVTLARRLTAVGGAGC